MEYTLAVEWVNTGQNSTASGSGACDGTVLLSATWELLETTSGKRVEMWNTDAHASIDIHVTLKASNLYPRYLDLGACADSQTGTTSNKYYMKSTTAQYGVCYDSGAVVLEGQTLSATELLEAHNLTLDCTSYDTCNKSSGGPQLRQVPDGYGAT
eukprot:TRINITY_DN10563_c0_g1_i2.p1 TRINITY_DN10563_c0_g1~~TRINITY_DN10563_c0_g1_i2.p1  ORF type:complete len:155 (+),score=17.70 TRINITY_DN10563_c0_g1_i2:743-1207(+)